MLKRILIAVWMMLATVAYGQQFGGRQPDPDPDPSSAARYEWEGVLVWNGGNLPEVKGTIEETMTRRAWASEAGKKAARALGLTESAAKEALQISWPSGGGLIRVSMTVPSDTSEARAAAGRFFNSILAEEVQPAVNDWVEAVNLAPLERASHSLDLARKQAADAREQVSERRRKIRDLADVMDPAPEAVRATASQLDQERQKITLELAGENARQKALQDRVAKLSDAAAMRMGDDPIAAELEKIVKLREAEMEMLAKAKEQVSQSAVRAAELQVAEAKARLLERRETAGRGTGSDLLSEMNKELITLTITIVENEARLQHVNQRFARIAKAMDQVDEFEQLLASSARAALQLDRAENNYECTSTNVTNSPALSVSVHWGEKKVVSLGKPKGEKEGAK